METVARCHSAETPASVLATIACRKRSASVSSSEAADIALTIHPHRTLGESVGMAAEVYEGTIIDLYLPKKK
ncbi:hypothetical protein ACPPVV_02700 [Rhodanobacter sp. Col0626]|uniref:hypothetical protein n=1 Tax=Rhodanobacter sp. Col0626 TaxID=3415679 RepID=UPI003CF89FC3